MLYIEHESKNKNAPCRASIKNKNAPPRAKLQNKFLELIFFAKSFKKFSNMVLLVI